MNGVTGFTFASVFCCLAVVPARRRWGTPPSGRHRKNGLRVAEHLTELPPKAVRQQRLH